MMLFMRKSVGAVLHKSLLRIRRDLIDCAAGLSGTNIARFNSATS